MSDTNKPNRRTIYIYLTVPKTLTTGILANGLSSGGFGDGSSGPGLGQKLPFLRGYTIEPKVTQGLTDYLKVEIDLDDKKFIQTNGRDCEYHGSISRDQIVAIATPPANYMETIALYDRCGKDIKHPDFEAAYAYRSTNPQPRENV